MSKNSSALSPYYKKHAFVRDVDGVNSAIKLLQPLETSIQFEFNLNSSLLNQWPEYALQLSGLWTPSLKVPILKPEPISSGIDIAGTLAAEAVDIPSIPQPVSTNTLFAESISNSPFSHKAMMCHENDLTQSERHKLFLDNVEELDMIAEEANKVENTEAASSNSQNDAQIKPSKSKKKSVKSLDLKADYKNLENISPTEEQKSTQSDYPLNSSAHGNSLSNLMRNSWCSDGSDGLSLASSTSRAAHSYSRTSSTCTPLEDYNALLQKHENSRNVDWTIMWEKFLAQNNANALGLSAPLGGGDIEEDALTLKSNNGEEFSEEPRVCK